MYTLADAVRLKDHVLERWEAADRDPELVDDGALNVVVVGGGPTGRRERRARWPSSTAANFAKDYPDVPQEQARLILVEAGPALFAMFKQDIRDYTRGRSRSGRVEVMIGEAVEVGHADAGHAEVGRGAQGAHARLGRRARRRARSSASLGLELRARRPDRRRARARRCPAIRRSSPSATSPGSPTRRRGQVLPQLGSVALQAGEHAGENIARRVAGKETKPFVYKDKGTMATIGRGAAVVQFLGGRTMKGKAATLAWGAVHLALLSTGEDRAKAVVDWTWAGFTHERSADVRPRTPPCGRHDTTEGEDHDGEGATSQSAAEACGGGGEPARRRS